MTRKIKSVDYSSAITPHWYKCNTCGAFGVKLWREYQVAMSGQSLACVDCAEKEQGRLCTLHLPKGERSDQIGWRVPAVPTEDGETYWGYSSVPQDGWDWWDRLPLRNGALA